jgi:ABC-type transporter MlaC component
MQAINLELFSEEDLKPSLHLQAHQIIQEKTSTITEDENMSYSEQDKKPEQLFNNLFLEPSDQSKASKARQILGNAAGSISDEELEAFTAKLEYLTNSWLDSLEKQLFDGKTLRELTKLDNI